MPGSSEDVGRLVPLARSTRQPDLVATAPHVRAERERFHSDIGAARASLAEASWLDPAGHRSLLAFTLWLRAQVEADAGDRVAALAALPDARERAGALEPSPRSLLGRHLGRAEARLQPVTGIEG